MKKEKNPGTVRVEDQRPSALERLWALLGEEAALSLIPGMTEDMRRDLDDNQAIARDDQSYEDRLQSGDAYGRELNAPQGIHDWKGNVYKTLNEYLLRHRKR